MSLEQGHLEKEVVTRSATRKFGEHKIDSAELSQLVCLCTAIHFKEQIVRFLSHRNCIRKFLIRNICIHNIVLYKQYNI